MHFNTFADDYHWVQRQHMPDLEVQQLQLSVQPAAVCRFRPDLEVLTCKTFISFSETFWHLAFEILSVVCSVVQCSTEVHYCRIGHSYEYVSLLRQSLYQVSMPSTKYSYCTVPGTSSQPLPPTISCFFFFNEFILPDLFNFPVSNR